MPDRYDPKLSVRPLSERRSEASASDDPLAELARIVTGRSPFDSEAGARGNTAPGGNVAPESNPADDLESELLNDLQASFAALSVPLEAPAFPQEETPATHDSSPLDYDPEPLAPPEPADTVDEAPYEEPYEEPFEQSFGQPFDESFETPFADSPEAAEPEQPAVEPSLEELLSGLASGDPAAEWGTPRPARQPEPTEPPIAAPVPPPASRAPPPPPPPEPRQAPEPRFVSSRRQAPALPVARERVPASERSSASERASPVERPSADERPNFSRLRLRPAPPAPSVRPADDQDALAARQPSTPSRRDRVDEAPPALDRLSRFAPPRAGAQIRPDPVRGPDVEPDREPEFEAQVVADAALAFDGRLPDETTDTGFDETFSLDDLDAAAYASDDDLPPFPEEELAGLKRRRSSRALTAVAGVLVIGLVGAGAFLFFGDDSSSGAPPPIIAADGSPTKVVPDDPVAGESDQQGKLIYDRVDDGAGGSETTLVMTGDDPIADIPAIDQDVADNPITRVIIPGGPGIDSPLGEADDGGSDGELVIAESAPVDDSDTELGPKKVRTVVVRPDGTIVSSEAVDEGGGAIADAESAEIDPAELALLEAGKSTRTDMDAVLEGEDLPVNTDPLGAISPVDPPDIETPAPGTVPAVDEVVVVEAVEPIAEAVPVVRELPTPAPAKPAKKAEPTIVATTGGADGPIDLTPGTPARSAGPQVSSGGVLVQVSAQRTEDAARSSYSTLQRRYPNILGPYQAAIIRADLGDRGIYYRVRIGPFSGSDATRLCDDLKAAGGDCMVAR